MLTRRFSRFLTVLGLLVVAQASPAAPLALASISELKERLVAIDEELEALAQISLNSGIGPIGYRSTSYTSANETAWVQIDLEEERRLDEVVLVPALWRDVQSGFVSDGFPLVVKVFVGTRGDQVGALVAELHQGSGTLHGIDPAVISLSGEKASWVRVEAARLSRRAFDQMHVFQLSEILVFQGEENIALHRPVTLSRGSLNGDAWHQKNLVDGILPYVMNAAKGLQSRALVAHGEGQPVIGMDLGEMLPLSGIRLHAADQSDTVPQAFSGDYGLPKRFRVEGAKSADFSDARVLLEGQIDSIFKVGPMMDWQFPEFTCRYVRLIATEPHLSSEVQRGAAKIAFAEIELLFKGLNVAQGKAVTSNFTPMGITREFSSLTDGRNLYGNILPVRQWLGELARRHELESQRPIIVAQLTKLYAEQKTKLRLMFWVAAGLILGIGFLVFYYGRRSRRHEAQIRERISANLHDNLGANLHAIGLLGDLAKEAVDEPKELIDTVERIRQLTERTGRAARDCANMIEASDVCQDLVAEMKRYAMSFLADLEHDLSFQGQEFLEQLSRRRRIDLFLFYKEALVNIIRHSEATAVETCVVADAKQVCLTVTDNGHGYDGEFPASLQRRARLLGAQARVTRPDSGGTCIALTLKTRKLKFFK